MTIFYLINRKYYKEWLGEFYVIVMNITLGLGIYIVGKNTFTGIYYTSIFLVIGFLIDNRNQKKLIFYSLFTVLCALFTYYVNVPIALQKLSEQEYSIVKSMNFTLCIILNTFFVWQLINVNNEAEDKLIHFAKNLDEHNRSLKDLNAELDQFAYRVSHDLRSPISSTLGLLYLAKEEHELKSLQEYHQMMEKSLTKLDDFIQEILTHTRNSRLPVLYEPIDNLAGYLQDITAPFTQNPALSHIQFSTAIEENAVLCTDATRLRMILQNLLSNAFHYHDVHKPKNWVKLTMNVEQKKVLIEITDNGIGIEEKHISKIFNMFYRATEKTPGTGLGLYIVKQILEKMEGKISVQSVYLSGTTFTVEFPNHTCGEVS
jgi:signal transduction histidine kinase